MKTELTKALTVLAFTVLILVLAGGGPSWAAEAEDPPMAAAAADGQADIFSPAPIFVSQCGFCSGNPTEFSPQRNVICTLTGCQGGSAHCCEYTCGCAPCTNPSETPSNACTLTIPSCPRQLCYTDYCDSEGVRCIASGCGVGGCCAYTCSPDASCTGVDPLPPGAC